METRRHIIILAIILALLLPLPAAAEAPIVIRIDRTDATNHPQAMIEATVRNEYGGPIIGLAAANFDVSEDRTLKSRPIVGVEPFVNPEVQLSVVLAVDVSGSMTGAKLRDAQEAARRFLDSLTPKDNASLIAFSNVIALDKADATREIGFGGEKTALYEVIDRLQAGGWTPLYDTAYKAVTWAAAAPPGNRAVLLFTDGKEEKAPDGTGGSKIANDDSPIREANRAGVPVFTIGLGTDADEAYLKRLALETGGTYQHAANSAELAQLFRNVADLLKQQYRITYTSGLPADGAAHQVLVAVTVGQHNAFTEAALGPLPLRLTPTTTPTKSPEPTATPLPTNTPEPTATIAPLLTPMVAGQPTVTPPVQASAGPLGISFLGWGGIALGVIGIAVLAIFGTRKPTSKPVRYRCLQCGHDLNAKDAPCPSCGFQGSYKS
jgi:VWFA-related protein